MEGEKEKESERKVQVSANERKVITRNRKIP